MSYSAYLTKCSSCQQATSKKYAREHGGKCKYYATGVASEPKGYKCPDCGRNTLTVYQKQQGYHCDICTHNTETSGGIYGF